MNETASRWPGVLVDHRPYQRMPEHNSRADLDESGILELIRAAASDLQDVSRTPHENGVTERLGRSNQSQPSRRRTHRFETPLESLLELSPKALRIAAL